MLAELRDDNQKLVEALREAKDIVDAARDNATSGILDDWDRSSRGTRLVPVRGQPQGLDFGFAEERHQPGTTRPAVRFIPVTSGVPT